jgi:hypothetical protein
VAIGLDPGQSVPAIIQQAPGVRIVVSGGILTESVPDQRDREINRSKRISSGKMQMSLAPCGMSATAGSSLLNWS